MENELKIAYLGPKGSFTEAAAYKIYVDQHVEDAEFDIQPSILDVIKSVDENPGLIGVVPIENSVEGIVRETIDNLLTTKNDVYITGETILSVSHSLISKSDSLSTVNKIISHPQALAQCREFVSKYFRDAEIIQSSSTSEAVRQLLAYDTSYAAIGNSLAAEIYGLNILQEDINDIKNNQTRFISIGDKIDSSTGNDKTFFVFATENKPGDLVKVLSIFSKNGINLSYIESRPSKRQLGEYNFFVNIEGHVGDVSVKNALDEIKPITTFFKFLGSYPAYPSNL